ncbi:MAG: SMC-Scp complex subunit ScpB [Candidatus Paceibacterota bacterium]|jgi:segregation and condensation protein B
MNLEAKIEAILFWKGEPVSLKRLAFWLGVDEKEIAPVLDELEKKLTDRGVALLRKDNEVALGTAPALGELMESLAKEELSGELSKASLETITIILYRGPVGKQEIDYIRGVNSGYTLRSLLIRGLVERLENPSDRRTYLYKPTFELLSYMGIKRLEDLPDYQAVREEIKNGELSEQN